MNELRDLYIPYEELWCHVCSKRTPYLRSGIKSHLLNFHNRDEHGQPIFEKKSAKRRRKTKTPTPTESPTESQTKSPIETPTESPTESPTDAAVNETGDENLVESEKVVGDEDLGGGLVYADACFWNEPIYYGTY